MMATLRFKDEACDTMSTVFKSMRGYTLEVEVQGGPGYDVVLRDVVIGEDGCWKLSVQRWSDEACDGDGPVFLLDPYEDVLSVTAP